MSTAGQNLATGFLGLLVLGVATVGCDIDSSTKLPPLQAFGDAIAIAAGTMEQIGSPETMQELQPTLMENLDEAIELGRKIKQRPSYVTDLDTESPQWEHIRQSLKYSGPQFQRAVRKLQEVRGGSLEFWNPVRLKLAELMFYNANVARLLLQAGLDSDDTGEGEARASAYMELAETELRFLREAGPEHVVGMAIQGTMSDEEYDAVVERVRAAIGSNGQTETVRGSGGVGIYAYPVTDFAAFRRELESGDDDLGEITFEDAGQRRIVFSKKKEPRNLAKKDDNREKSQGKSRPRDLPDFSGEVESPERKPEEGTPEYYEWLTERMGGDDRFAARGAAEKLNKLRPADVPSQESRAVIARGFREVALNSDDPFLREDAVEGLVVWGGKYSTPILLQIFPDDSSRLNEALLDAFAELKDPAAAECVARALGDFFLQEDAYKCLQRMGTAAEDGLIAAAPSNNAEVCLAAIRLLGSGCGTEKCLPTLQKALRSRNPQVRDAAAWAQRSIQSRVSEQPPSFDEDATNLD